MHKVCSDKLTAGMLSGDFKEKVHRSGFQLYDCIKGSPAY